MAMERPWASSSGDVAETHGVDPRKGLTHDEVEQRLVQHGPNVLRRTEQRGLLQILWGQLRSIIVALLAAAAIISIITGDYVDAIAVLVVVALNTCIGFFTEVDARDSMEALRSLGSVETTVRRDGSPMRVSAESLVPGDVVILDGGDIVTADLRLTEASRMQADEAALTGESLPVAKSVEPVCEDSVLAERPNMVFKGTAVTRGTGEGVVVATGMATELGQISHLVSTATERETPLQQNLESLGHRLVWVTLVVTALVGVAGFVAGRELAETIETAIALAIAAVPEGLPIVATIALARGMHRMAKHKALIENLPAVETLGSVDIILTDKTGTLTENRMVVASLSLTDRQVVIDGGFSTSGEFTSNGEPIEVADDHNLELALQLGVLCGNATLGRDPSSPQHVGDPMEVALLMAAAKGGIDQHSLTSRLPELREDAFDPETKLMATYHRAGGEVAVAVKGAPDSALERCTHELTDRGPRPLDAAGLQRWAEINESLAADGLRVLAIATKTVASADEPPYEDLTIVALCAFYDPPRLDVADAIDDCARAGVRLVMLTGDQPTTARFVGRSVGLVDDDAIVIHGRDLTDLAEEPNRAAVLDASIIARVSPQQKLDVLDMHQQAGSIVAMVGDGVNDAPALKKADIGVSMGIRGTQVAQQASDMVLLDDRLGTIATAIREGRVIFDNIRSFVVYLLSCNLSEILAVAAATAINPDLTLLPLQILFLNLVTDVFPALALGAGRGGANLMDRKPRDPEEQVLTRRHWMQLAWHAATITAAALGVLLIADRALDLAPAESVSLSFLTLAFAQLWHVFNMAAPGSSPLRNEVTSNRWIWGALGLCTILLLAATYVPGLAGILDLSRPTPGQWLLVLGFSLLPLISLGQRLGVSGGRARESSGSAR
ncbi:MAG: cation-transporting P-type ATPase [Actinomycetia bacterium]|nr:cation-transporting P-type ATPase [Actinomycetes bacterium]